MHIKKTSALYFIITWLLTIWLKKNLNKWQFQHAYLKMKIKKKWSCNININENCGHTNQHINIQTHTHTHTHTHTPTNAQFCTHVQRMKRRGTFESVVKIWQMAYEAWYCLIGGGAVKVWEGRRRGLRWSLWAWAYLWLDNKRTWDFG